MSGHMTEKLVADALEQAVGRESPPDDFSLVFHDDQGSQHASRAFQRCLESHGIAQSMPRPGNPWDDALAESFLKTLKRELANGKGARRGRRRSGTCSNTSSPTATGRGCAHRLAITSRATWSEMLPEEAYFFPSKKS